MKNKTYLFTMLLLGAQCQWENMIRERVIWRVTTVVVPFVNWAMGTTTYPAKEPIIATPRRRNKRNGDPQQWKADKTERDDNANRNENAKKPTKWTHERANAECHARDLRRTSLQVDDDSTAARCSSSTRHARERRNWLKNFGCGQTRTMTATCSYPKTSGREHVRIRLNPCDPRRWTRRWWWNVDSRSDRAI